MSSTRQVIYTLGLSVLIIALAAAALAQIPAATWTSWQPATCLQAGGCFCEAARSGEAILQPVNTWSSFAYVFVGIWIALGAATAVAGTPYNRVTKYAVGLSTVIIGLGSAFYHASLTFTGQFFDILGMYLLAALMLVYALQRLCGWTLTQAVLIYLGFNAVLSVVQIALPDTRRYLFALVLLAALGVEVWYRRHAQPTLQPLWLHLGLGLFAVAFIVWIFDSTGVVCAPASLVQGHALWHTLGALAVGCLHRYYVSERPKHA